MAEEKTKQEWVELMRQSPAGFNSEHSRWVREQEKEAKNTNKKPHLDLRNVDLRGISFEGIRFTGHVVAGVGSNPKNFAPIDLRGATFDSEEQVRLARAGHAHLSLIPKVEKRGR